MNIIIIDTCVFIAEQDYFFNKPKLKFVSGLNSNMVKIPNIIFEEVIGNIRKNFSSINDKISDSNNKLKSLSIPVQYKNLDTLECEKVLKKHRKSLEDTYYENNISIENYPQNLKIDDIINRALGYKKPFKPDGGDAGFKDYIIWQTILEIAKQNNNCNIIFITNNSKDFKDGSNIHKDLQEDVKEKNLNIQNIKIVSLDEYIKSIANFEIKNIDKIINDLKNGDILIYDELNEVNLHSYIDNNLYNLSSIGALQSDFFGYIIELISVEFIELCKNSIVCRAIDDNDLYIEFELEGEFGASIGDYYIKPIKLVLNMSIIYDQAEGICSSIDISRVTCLSDLNSRDIYDAECSHHAEFMRD